MDKNGIFKERKAIKKQAHRVLRSHYFILIFSTLILILFGSEYSYIRSQIGDGPATLRAVAEGTALPGEEPDDAGNILSTNEVYYYVETADLEKADELSDQIAAERALESSPSKMLGRTNGVLATLVNTFGTGKLMVKIGQGIYSITKSRRAVSVISISGSLLFYFLVFFLIKNVLSAVLMRPFLEARVYEQITFMSMLRVGIVRRWLRACKTMLVQYVLYTLWSLTIVGVFIKTFSYFCVPYIVAENPDARPLEAITLSRKMMDGHKWELCKFEISYILWWILSAVTFGISEMVYGLPYRIAGETEFYARVRRDAIDRGVEGVSLLNDRYLYEKADKILLYETYFDVVDEITVLHENKVELKGVRRFFADWFGIWLGTLPEKRRYDEQEGRLFKIQNYRMSMEGKAYPGWLSPLQGTQELDRQINFHFLRNYSVWTLILLFIGFSSVGWIWEVTLHFIQTGEYANRGTLFGPWLPIYGSGGVIVLLLCSRFRKKPVVEFFTAIVLCGILEYFSGWYLEMKYHQRWWSYDGYFLNLHGRICAEGLLVFGVGCCAVVYLLAPVFDFLVMRVKQKILIGISIVLLLLFGTDMAYSRIHPNTAEGAVEAAEEDDGSASGEADDTAQKEETPEAEVLQEEAAEMEGQEAA